MLRYAFVVFLFFLLSGKKMYHRDYHANGKLKAQGWKVDMLKEGFWKYFYQNGKLMEKGHYHRNLKEGYWYFYDKNGYLTSQGHMRAGKKVNWWLFYDENGNINHKCQLQNGIKNGYCLKYVNEELKSAEKFKDGKKIKEWFSFASFKKENKLSDLH